MLSAAICWALIAVLCIQPLRGRWRWRRFLARRDVPGERARYYRSAIVTWWALAALWVVALALANVSFVERELGAPRSSTPTRDGVVALAFAAALFVPLAFARWRRSAFGQLGDVRALLPHDARERRWFFALSLTAGGCEEALYRSFAVAMVQRFLPSAPWWAYFVAGSVPFGLGHLYQGKRGVVLTTLLGLWFTALYLGFRSLWPAIGAHAPVDVRAGALSWFLPSAEAAASDRAAA